MKIILLALVVTSTFANDLSGVFQAKNIEELQAATRRMVEGNQEERHRENLRLRMAKSRGLELEKSTPILADNFGGSPGFYHSVASGDPLSDAVVIWTRYTPATVDEIVTLEFRLAALDGKPGEGELDPSLLDPSTNADIKRGYVTVSSDDDFIAKIDVTGLESNTHYVYAFSVAGTDIVSHVGLTRTAPSMEDEAETLTYAFFSCAHFSNGFFHGYDIASTVENIDLALFVGDYYYEYGNYDSYARDASAERDPLVLPEWEVIDLQDYRNRHATYVGRDEGLQFLRRRVPVMATWDDHETTNDSHGDVNNVDAENHQEVCPVDSSATDVEKNENQCDRDEGDAVTRFEFAAQAFMEWLPLRYVPGNMGQLQVGQITKTIEWGSLATIVGLDTRMSYRSQAGGSAFDNPGYGFVAFSETNVSAYSDPNTEIAQTLYGIAMSDLQERLDENRTIIGDSIQILEDAFEKSKADGKPWQIWAGNTMMGHYVLPPPENFHLDAPDATAPFVKGLWDAILPSSDGLIARILSALAAVDIEWNQDDYSGFHFERQKIVELAQTKANNMIVLGGDLHDGFAWVVPSSGRIEGEPAFVNLGCASVTSPGFAPNFLPFFASIADAIGGLPAVMDILEKSFIRENENLKLVNLEFKGATVVTVTRDTHTAEYFGVTEEDRVSNYETARNGALTAEPICKGRVVTNAAEAGSLESFDDCSSTTFESERPVEYTLDIPVAEVSNTLQTLSDCGYKGCTVFVGPTTAPTSSPTTAAANRNNDCADVEIEIRVKGKNEVPPVDNKAKATYILKFFGTTICYEVSGLKLDGNTFERHHIHGPASENENSGVIVNLGSPAEEGCIEGVAPEDILAIVTNPDDYYINMHSLEIPSGFARGQLAKLGKKGKKESNYGGKKNSKKGKKEFEVTLDPLQEVHEVVINGGANVEYELEFYGTTLCFEIDIETLDGNVWDRHHIHGPAPAGSNAGVVIDLGDPQTHGCIEGVDMEVVQAITTMPSLFYINMHSEQTPAGFTRGQLALCGEEDIDEH